MSADNWTWWVGYDGEHYHSQCGSRDEAVRIASEEQDGGWICEAKKSEILLASYFDADAFLESAEDRAFDDHGDPDGNDTIFDVSCEDNKSLEAAVRAAITKWQTENGLGFTGWKFTGFRNEEYVPGAAQ